MVDRVSMLARRAIQDARVVVIEMIPLSLLTVLYVAQLEM
jgi:hypothetical protein